MVFFFFQIFAQGLFTSSKSERENFVLSVNAPQTNFHFADINTAVYWSFSIPFSLRAGTNPGRQILKVQPLSNKYLIHLHFLSLFCQHNVQNTNKPSVEIWITTSSTSINFLISIHLALKGFKLSLDKLII